MTRAQLLPPDTRESLPMPLSPPRPSAPEPRKPETPEPLTLITLLQKPVWGMLLGTLLGALLVYGFSGIIYFTNQIITVSDTNTLRLNLSVVLHNISYGVFTVLMVYGLADKIDRWFTPVWQRHLLLSVLAVGTTMLVGTLIYFMVDRGLPVNQTTYPSSKIPWCFYFLGPLVVANMFAYVLRQGKQLTRKLSDQEIQLLNLEQLKTRAELDALQAKINPHFLYNALNSIASLVHEDPEKAEEMTLLLSRLFRYTTGRTGDYFISLADELEMVCTYLKVEQVRFGERLAFSVDVADPALNALRLPQFLLQPIVENSVKHGIAKSAGPGRIDVKIYREADCLYLSVHDSGPAFPDALSVGYGLRSIQDKLKLLYGDEARVDLGNTPYKQVLIAVKLSRLKKPLVE